MENIYPRQKNECSYKKYHYFKRIVEELKIFLKGKSRIRVLAKNRINNINDLILYGMK